MRDFDYKRLAKNSWDNEILLLCTKIHECKGRQDLFVIQKRQPRNTGIAAPIKFVSKYKIMEFLSFRRPYVAVVLH